MSVQAGNERERVPGENGPWKMNLDFTVRGETMEDCERKADAMNRTATRLGLPHGHTDMSEPDDG